MFRGVKVIAIMHCMFGLQVMSCELSGHYVFRAHIQGMSEAYW